MKVKPAPLVQVPAAVSLWGVEVEEGSPDLLVLEGTVSLAPSGLEDRHHTFLVSLVTGVRAKRVGTVPLSVERL